jgi:predicted dehydrogenase
MLKMQEQEKEFLVTVNSQQLTGSVVRVGVIGLGFAGETHVKSYRQLPNVEVVALAGLEEDKLRYLGTTYDIPHLYRQYDELLARDDLDAISICVPNYLHAPIALAAFERGMHVLCEKPLARNGVEAEQMVRAATQANRVLKVVFNRRARSDMQVLKRYIEEGNMGTIYYTKASWMRRYGIPGRDSWFINKEMAGGGPLIDLGVHVLDMALYLLGEPRVITVSASTFSELGVRAATAGKTQTSQKYSVGSTFEVEDLATAFLRLAGGATLLLESSWVTHSNAGDDFGVVCYGTESGAEIKVENYNWQDTLRIYTDVAGAPAEIRPQLTRGEGHLAMVREFIAAITEGNWSAHNGSDGLYRVRILDACYVSATRQREVSLADDGTIEEA